MVLKVWTLAKRGLLNTLSVFTLGKQERESSSISFSTVISVFPPPTVGRGLARDVDTAKFGGLLQVFAFTAQF